MHPRIVDVRERNPLIVCWLVGYPNLSSIHRFRCLGVTYDLELCNVKFIYIQYHLLSIKGQLIVWTLQNNNIFSWLKLTLTIKSISIA